MEYTDIVNDDFELTEELETVAYCTGGGFIIAGIVLVLSAIIPLLA